MTKSGEIIKARRKELRISAEQIADVCGVNPSTVYRWESGDIDNIPSTKIKALADILQISPSVIVGDLEDSEKQYVPHFNTAQEAIEYILRQPLVAAHGGYDLSKMTDQQIIDFANEIAGMIQFMAKHYNK